MIQILPDTWLVIVEKKKLFNKTIPTLDLSIYGTPKEVERKVYTLFSEECFNNVPELWHPFIRKAMYTSLEDGSQEPKFFVFGEHVIKIEEIIWKQSKKRKASSEIISRKGALVRLVGDLLKVTAEHLTHYQQKLLSLFTK